jgi:selenocysteine lyase/cysteine desulfurase
VSAAYLNHAGTSWPKPPPVREAVRRAMAPEALETWTEDFVTQHAAVAAAVGSPSDALLLTPGCTSALALAVADLPWRAGDRALVDGHAHEALDRPIAQLVRRGVEVERLAPFTVEAVEAALAKGPARLLAMTWVVNVTGAILPVEEAATLARARGTTVLVDAAQAVGWLDIDLGRGSFDLCAFGGHKGLQGPWGIGGLYGVASLTSPRGAPTGHCDGGSVDRAALAGLAAGVRWLGERPGRLPRARRQIARLEAAAAARGLEVVGPPLEARTPILALRVPDAPRAARRLAEEGVIASGGLQCAPRAHAALGSAGLLRLSVGPATTDDEVTRAADALLRGRW